MIWIDTIESESEYIPGLTNDGLFFLTGEFNDEDLEYIKQNNYKFLRTNQLILATGIKSVEYKEGVGVLLTKFDGTLLVAEGYGFVEADFIQTMGNLALKRDGTLWDTGNYENEDIISAKDVPFTKIMSNVKQIIENGEERIVLKNDESVWGWRHEDYSNNKIYKDNPKKLLSGVVKINSIGRYGICAIDRNGILWEYDSYSLGFNKLMDKAVDVYDSMSISDKYKSIYVLKNNGILYEYYTEIKGGLSFKNVMALDKEVEWITKTDKILEDVESVTKDDNVLMVIKKDKSLWSWGNNEYGEVGDGTTVDRTKPKKILDSVKSVTIKDSNIYAIKTDGALWAWGSNENGMVGDGTEKTRTKPIKIIKDATYFNQSDELNIVIKNDESVWAWGDYNDYTGIMKGNILVPQRILD